MFKSHPEHYQTNITQAPRMKAREAIIGGSPDEEPGVVIFKGSQITAVLPLHQALRLATEIADAIEHHKQNNTTDKEPNS